MTRVRRRRRRFRRDSGLTLIELLLSLALMALLAAFIAGGLVFARRAFLLDRTADLGEDADAAVQTLAGLLASAVAAPVGDGAAPGAVLFDGDRASVSFVGLGAGHALRGGLHVIRIRLDGGQLIAEVRPTRGADAKPGPGEAERRVVLLAGVREADFGFFGNPKALSSIQRVGPQDAALLPCKEKQTSVGEPTNACSGAPAWRSEWAKGETLPRQVSVRLAFDGKRPSPPELVVTLNQR